MKALRASVSLVRIAICVQCIVHVLFRVSPFGELGIPKSERMQIICRLFRPRPAINHTTLFALCIQYRKCTGPIHRLSKEPLGELLQYLKPLIAKYTSVFPFLLCLRT